MTNFLFINKLSDIGFDAQAYSWFHFLFVLLTIIGIVLVSKYAHPEISKKTRLTFLITVLVIMFIGEVYKEYDYYRHGLRGTEVINEFPWITFPWQFCDTPVYILFLVLVIPSEKFKKVGFTYLQIFGFIAGLAVMISPSEAYTNRLVVSIQTMIHHGLMIVLSAFICKVKLAGKFKEFIGASIILLSFIVVAFFTNLIFHDMSDGVINNFYINPKLPTVYPLLDKIQEISYIFFLISYVLLFLGLGVAFYYLFDKYELFKEKIIGFIKKKRTEEKLNLFIFVFFVLVSIFSKYLILNSFFFPTVSFYNLPFKLVLNGFFGNFIVGLTIGLTTFLVFKNIKHRYIVLTVFLLITSIIMFVQMVYAKYYNTLFHYSQTYVAKNPAGELLTTQTLRQIKDLFIFMQFLVLLPPLVYFYFSRYVLKYSLISDEKLARIRSFKLIYAKGLALILVIFLGLVSYMVPIQASSINSNNEDALYGVQSSGFYNYYFWKLTKINKLSASKLSEEEVKIELKKHSKNKDTYTNIFGETIIRNFNTSEIRNVVLSEELQNKEIIGLFKDKNLITVQLETVPMFLVEIALNHPEFKDQNLFPNLRLLLSESYQFNNFYDSVGAGHTADGEFSAMTGLYSRGYDTLYWEYNKKPFKIDFSLPILFKNNGYENISVNGDVKEFYNVGVINKNLYKVDHDYFNNSKKDHHKKYNASQALKDKYDFDGKKIKITRKKLEGLLDYAMVNWLSEITKDAKEPYYIRAHTVHPHTPFPNVFENKLKFPSRYKMTEEGAGLFDYISYIDAYFGEFIKLTRKTENTVYLFFGDHGPTGYYPFDLEILYGKKLTNTEYRQHLNKTLAFMYVPNDNNLNENNLKKGEIVGYQELIRSQVDIHRTILELFDLERNHHYFGVNMLSNERTYAINPKGNLMIYADDFIINPTRYGKVEFVTWLGDNKDYNIESIYNDISKMKIFFDNNIITPKKFDLLKKEE